MKINLLIAEDDEDYLFLVKNVLDDLHLQVDAGFVRNGAELIDVLNRSAELPTHILLDLNMPKLNGLETLSYLKSQNRFRHIPVFIISGSNNHNDKANCMQKGAEAYFLKPELYKDWKIMINNILILRKDRKDENTIPVLIRKMPFTQLQGKVCFII